MSGRTETISTEFGDLDVELVECSSCGNEVRKTDAEEFTIGSREGWACEYCADEGPIDFPGKSTLKGSEIPFIGLVILIFPAIFAAILVFVLPEPEPDEDMIMIVAFILGAIFWTAFVSWFVVTATPPPQEAIPL